MFNRKNTLFLICFGFVVFFFVKYFSYGNVDDRILRTLLFCIVTYPIALLVGVILGWFPYKWSIEREGSDNKRNGSKKGNPHQGAAVFWVLSVFYLSVLALVEFGRLEFDSYFFVKTFGFLGLIVFIVLLGRGHSALRYFLSLILFASAIRALMDENGGITQSELELFVAVVGGVLAFALVKSKDVTAYLDSKKNDLVGETLNHE